MMASTLLRQSTSGLLTAHDVVEEYARIHGIQVWIWRREGEAWTLLLGTAPRDDAPGEGGVPIPVPGGGTLHIETASPDGRRLAEDASFLASLLARLLQNEAESRFFGRELAERYEEITLLYSISEILGSVISLEEATVTILREVIDTMGVGRASLWIHNISLDLLELVAAVGGNEPQALIAVADDDSVTAGVFRERRSMILGPGDEYPRDASLAGALERDSFLSVPVSYTPPHGEPRTIGVINLIGRTVEEGFSAGDQKLITAIASQIGAAVENSRLVADSLQQERLVREMELAHDLQLKLLPSVEQFREHFDVGARCAPADSVGGDFYHLFRLPGGRIGVMIGDVSSHGFAAALIMALSMSAVAIHASEGDPPAEVLRRVHRTLIDELESTEMYLTLFYAVIDPAQGRLTYANAGHPHAFRITADGEAERLAPTNPPFGIIDLDNYDEEVVEWDTAGDLLFLFTDGLSDSIGLSDGEAILVREAIEGRKGSLDTLTDRLFACEQTSSDIPADDRTAILVRV